MQSDVLIRGLYAAKHAAGQPVVLFEFFPPKTEEGERNFCDKVLPQSAALKLDYCSVTYGAGGGTRDKTSGIHFYTLNEVRSTTRTGQNLNLV